VRRMSLERMKQGWAELIARTVPAVEHAPL
jgi:hypothetical protein